MAEFICNNIGNTFKIFGKMQIKPDKYENIVINYGDILSIYKFGNKIKSDFGTDILVGFNFASYFWITAIPRCEVEPKKPQHIKNSISQN
jgi:hypothetical protein